MWVTNVRGTQVHSPVSPDTLSRRHLIFVDGTMVDVERKDNLGEEGFDFVEPSDPRYIPLDTPSTPDLPIVTIVETASTITMTSHDGSKVIGAAGKYQVNLGKVDPLSGFQIGEGNTQINRF